MMENWIKAGKISAEVREYAKTLIKPGEKLFDVAEKIESKIVELGGCVGFPVNISLNSFAAHYTPVYNDDLIFRDQVVKVDIGVCVEGAIGDSAFTVDLSGNYSKLVDASEDALKEASKILKPGVTLGEIGKTIYNTINSYGYTPIKNLSGHGLDLYSVHSKPQIPNYDTGDSTKLEKGMFIAIEPFATNGKGMVKESGEAMIFSQVVKRPVRDPVARKLLAEISELKGLPFASRHFVAKYGQGRLRLALRALKQSGIIHDYPPLVEVDNGIVTQAEHSFYIDDEVITLTG